MTEVEKKGIGKTEIGLIVCGVAVALLVISNILVYVSLQNQVETLDTNNSNLQSQMNSLTSEKNSLQNQVESLTTENEDLQSQVNLLIDENDDLWSETWSLKEPQLHKVETYWADNHPMIGSPYVDYYGSIFNSGSWTAWDVIITVRIYDSHDTLLKTEEIDIGNIAGKSYQAFDVDIEYSGDADSLTSTLSYD